MLSRKNKPNKFHLPGPDPDSVEESSSVDVTSSSDPGPEEYGEEYYEEVESPDEAETHAQQIMAEANRYRLVIVKGKQPQDANQRTWEIYYRDRTHAKTVGDPLLKVVEAETREEAEYKALYMSNMANGGIVAVGGHQEDGKKSRKKESEFSFPAAHSPPQENGGSPRIFRGK